MRKLIEKFKLEQNNLSDAVIISYINDFKKISQKLENRDIMTYSWKDLENTVDSNRSTRIKAGKIDVTAEDANLLYNQDGVRIYHGKDKTACIKYSNGYSFCIGARGDRNLYSTYRYHDNSEKEKVGTPYFVFNDNLDKKDPSHILVIFEFSIKMKDSEEFIPDHYTVTNADNSGDKRYDDFNSIVAEYPWVALLRDLMIENKGLTHDERQFRMLVHNQETKAYLLGRDFLKKYSVNEIKQDFYRKLFNFLFESVDPWHNRNQTPREKYDAMMKGMQLYRCGFDRFDMMRKYEHDGERDNNLYDFIKKINDDKSFYLLADPENFTPGALDYIKRFVMPWAQEGFDGIEGETYDKVIEYALYSFDKRKRVYTDLEQLSAITLGTREINIDLEEIIR
jgi:uncharacterized protein YlaI